MATRCCSSLTVIAATDEACPVIKTGLCHNSDQYPMINSPLLVIV